VDTDSRPLQGVDISEGYLALESGTSVLLRIKVSLHCDSRHCCYRTDIELVYNAVIALVMVQPYQSGETLTNILCEKLGGQPGDKHSSLRLRL